ncbi:MAG: amino acid ABC transporter permease [Ruminococcus sp.]|nr:amino acid ABC transporter permease [Ruminococcus sp.]
MQEFFESIKENFISTFIVEERWEQLLSGLGITLLITFFAVILGIVIGCLIAIVRSSYETNVKLKKKKSFGDRVIQLLNIICQIYLTVIRGTPVVVQLMIMYFIIFANSRDSIFAAILSFGINSGAYVAEIIRSGIMSIDKGQFEASRSLGFNYRDTMIHIILPQAFKNVLPALGNEFIVLLKETSVAGYVAVQDLTYVANLIRSRTYEAFFPLITTAVIYLVLVMILTFFLGKLERRLRNSDH